MRLFGTDGIRGLVGVDITAELVLKIGISAGIYFKKNNITNKILIGKDTRKSGYMVENALVSGLTSVGADVIQIGPMPTPAVAFLTEDMRCDAGIMVSASHNPFEDNGIKFFDFNGYKLDEKKEREIEKIYQNLESMKYSTKKEIGYSKRIDDVAGRYIVHIKNSFSKNLNLQNIRVVLDCANGAGYKVGPSVLRELGADVIVLGDNPNGYNINENCGAMFPNRLSYEVKRLRADIGFALDGDADRLIVVDEKGNIIDGDKLIGALALFLKEQNELKNNGAAFTLMSNVALDEFLKSKNINVARSNVGDKYLLEIMNNNNYIFGGEQSGHIIFSKYAKTGDGLVSALQILNLLKIKNKKASEALNLFELFPQVQGNINITKKIPLDEIKELSELLKEIEKNNMRHLIRYSGTENKLRILLEGENEKELENYKNIIFDILKSKLN